MVEVAAAMEKARSQSEEKGGATELGGAMEELMHLGDGVSLTENGWENLSGR